MLGGEGKDGLFESGGELLAAAVGGGDDPVELAQAEEVTQESQASAALESKDEVSGDQEAVQEGEPLGSIEEACGDGVEVEATLAVQPVLQGSAGQLLSSGKLASGTAESLLLVEIVAQPLGGGSAVVTGQGRGGRGGVRGGRIAGHGSAPG